jgi:putative nucleotidyltransferase with HDIG domain
VIAAFLAGQTYLLLGGQFQAVISTTNIVPLIGAAGIDTLANIGILLGVLYLQTGKPVVEIWVQNFQWSVPISILGGVLGGGALAVANELAGIWGVLIFFLPVVSIGYSFRLYANRSRDFINQLEQLNLELKNSNEQLALNNQELLETLAAVVDAYDIYTAGHSTNVADLAVEIGTELGLDPANLKRIERAGYLHDIGKVGISDAIIQKPGPLTEAEYEVVKTHSGIGAEIVGRMSGLQPLVPTILHHHERWDGGGYPGSLAGEQIPLEARILALADTVDTMCSDRPYRSARSPEQVVQEVRRCSGSQFDPQIVLAFDQIIAREGYAFFENSRNPNNLLNKYSGT